MGSDINLLISILYEMTIVKVALSIDKSLLSNDTLEYLMEESSREEIRKYLPLHVQAMGPIVDVETIFDVSVYGSTKTKIQRDVAIRHLAEWCVAIDEKGSGWDDWDEYYKDARWRKDKLCDIRDLLDDQIDSVFQQFYKAD